MDKLNPKPACYNPEPLCRICGDIIFGYGGHQKIPLCKKHCVLTAQLLCYYGNREECPFPHTDEEWVVAGEIFEFGIVPAKEERT